MLPKITVIKRSPIFNTLLSENLYDMLIKTHSKSYECQNILTIYSAFGNFLTISNISFSQFCVEYPLVRARLNSIQKKCRIVDKKRNLQDSKIH